MRRTPGAAFVNANPVLLAVSLSEPVSLLGLDLRALLWASAAVTASLTPASAAAAALGPVREFNVSVALDFGEGAVTLLLPAASAGVADAAGNALQTSSPVSMSFVSGTHRLTRIASLRDL